MLSYTLIAGLLFGLYFTLIGLGLNLVFGVMRIVNLAHGDFLMLGAFVAYWLFTLFAINPLPAVPVAFGVFLLIGLPLYRLLVPRLLRARDPEMLSFILFFGLSQAIEAIATIAFGTGERSIPGRVIGESIAAALSLLSGHPAGTGPVSILGQRFPMAWAVSAAVSALAVVLVYVYLYRTRLGTLTRAVMVERDEALATGIDVHRVSAIAFGVGLGLAALAGVFAPFMLGSITPAMGVNVTVTSFAVIVIGSLGNPLGTVLGGLVYGVSYMFMQSYYSSWANLLPYLLLIAILLVRPSGLLGRQVRRA
ncbi:MAG: High-affinity branched-chain amino acid transport system permease protein LivH [Burkholderiaceae bacterium]|nr:High-affinity branched-chain amino acid transport system permease protein LivH [Burkholderiaceae bacterium]